jgi:hypothetical protein
MKATTTTPSEHPPLARDSQGHLLPIPDGTCAWRVSRHTKGRPRVINGPDKQPARFPLDLTAEELADTCGADTYRVYALDEVGNVLDYVTTVDTGRELRNAAESDMTVLPPLRTNGSSDLRYALEVVAQIARTNADAMRGVAESQAEWIKSISSARGFFRNAPQLQLPERDHEENDHDELDQKPDWVEQVQPIVGMVVQQLVAMILGPKERAEPRRQRQRLEIADMLDWRRAAAKHQEAQQAREHISEAALDPHALRQALAGKAVAIAALMEPDERARLMGLAPMLGKLAADPEIARMLAELVAMSTEDAVAWIRSHIDEIEKGLAS